jgi:hypothetical protein
MVDKEGDERGDYDDRDESDRCCGSAAATIDDDRFGLIH